MADHAAARRAEAEALAAPLPPLLVAAERVAATVSQGMHGRRRVGPGESFWQFRRYQPGDTAAAVDWRRSARSQNLYVRETEWAAAQSVWLWVDASPSMAFRSARSGPTKAERATLLALALGSLLVRGGERVALLGTGLPPAGGRAAIRRLAEALDLPAAGTGLPPPDSLPRHARLVLIGGFLAPLPEVEAALAGFAAQGVRGHLLQVLDPAEEALPYRGRVRFEDPEDGTGLLVGQAEALRGDYRRRLQGHRDGLAALARARGWTLGLHRSDHPPETALLALFEVLGEPC